MELPYEMYDESKYLETIGDYVHVGENSIIEAASIGNNVYIGRNCVVGRFAIIKDCVIIKDNTVVAPNTVIPSFSLVSGGPPSVIIDTLPESAMDQLESRAKSYYMKFTPK
ncbi:hypothetical protein BB561_000722 [Smittium simulii]|uniref:Dynactin subunit 5 n=1 Tax=Smittium simulii TaxID=133385 RepID=A0A2T9YXV2_9FUNG|nr:hypothetical protein BB561_000722 [Smittium simulii]